MLKEVKDELGYQELAQRRSLESFVENDVSGVGREETRFEWDPGSSSKRDIWLYL